MGRMALFTGLRLLIAFITMLALTQCAASSQKKEWDNIDYSKVRNRSGYDNDSGYKLPSVSGCTDDDLYNCN